MINSDVLFTGVDVLFLVANWVVCCVYRRISSKVVRFAIGSIRRIIIPGVANRKSVVPGIANRLGFATISPFTIGICDAIPFPSVIVTPITSICIVDQSILVVKPSADRND